MLKQKGININLEDIAPHRSFITAPIQCVVSNISQNLNGGIIVQYFPIAGRKIKLNSVSFSGLAYLVGGKVQSTHNATSVRFHLTIRTPNGYNSLGKKYDDITLVGGSPNIAYIEIFEAGTYYFDNLVFGTGDTALRVDLNLDNYDTANVAQAWLQAILNMEYIN